MTPNDIHIREHLLPGIGRRFDLDIGTGETLIVVALRDGAREVAVGRTGEGEPDRTVHLNREQAVAVGSLLLGARFAEEPVDSTDCEVDVTTVVLHENSPAIGQVPSEIRFPGRTEATVVAVARDETPQLLEDDRHRTCEPGDRLVIAARRSDMDEVVRHIRG